eukprot:GFYU01007471.1.p1 GENE.GFYU01007471.1~~GFYU01007471.1.p1  ORF type:complete len:118 (-),score=34.45 GFYU01007471.1:225-578(-)
MTIPEGVNQDTLNRLLKKYENGVPDYEVRYTKEDVYAATTAATPPTETQSDAAEVSEMSNINEDISTMRKKYEPKSNVQIFCCPTCHGAGVVKEHYNWMMIDRTCTNCKGEGVISKE